MIVCRSKFGIDATYLYLLCVNVPPECMQCANNLYANILYPYAGLENDEYVRQIAGYLPTAEVAFVDEIFKANSAILNALLTLLNERLFDNGNQRLPVPLLCLVWTSSLGHLLCAPVLRIPQSAFASWTASALALLRQAICSRHGRATLPWRSLVLLAQQQQLLCRWEHQTSCPRAKSWMHCLTASSCGGRSLRWDGPAQPPRLLRCCMLASSPGSAQKCLTAATAWGSALKPLAASQVSQGQLATLARIASGASLGPAGLSPVAPPSPSESAPAAAAAVAGAPPTASIGSQLTMADFTCVCCASLYCVVHGLACRVAARLFCSTVQQLDSKHQSVGQGMTRF